MANGGDTCSRPLLDDNFQCCTPAASSLAFMSAFLIFQISASCFFVTLPTLSWFGFAEPEAMLAAFFRSTEAGGDFRMNVKLLSVNTVITTGRIMPF